MKKILFVSNYGAISKDLNRMSSLCPNSCSSNMIFTSKSFQSVDMVVTFNAPSKVVVGISPLDSVVKIVQEPRVKTGLKPRFFLRFVHRHAKVYSHVLGHAGCFDDPVEGTHVEHAPLVHPHVSLTFESSLRSKSELLSVISSNLTNLPGHRARNKFVGLLQESHPELASHIYGRGRNEINRKEEALDGYLYSVAIENTKINSYITEKFLDCILRETVPIYYGAENIEDYFPADCFIRLENLDMASAQNILRSLSREDYERRLPALLEAKERFINSMQLCCVLKRELEKAKASKPNLVILYPTLETVVSGVLSGKLARIVKSLAAKSIVRFKLLGGTTKQRT